MRDIIRDKAIEVAAKLVHVREHGNEIWEDHFDSIPLRIDTGGLIDICADFIVEEFSPMIEQSAKNDAEIERHRTLESLRVQEIRMRNNEIELLQETIESLQEKLKEYEINDRCN